MGMGMGMGMHITVVVVLGTGLVRLLRCPLLVPRLKRSRLWGALGCLFEEGGVIPSCLVFGLFLLLLFRVLLLGWVEIVLVDTPLFATLRWVKGGKGRGNI